MKYCTDLILGKAFGMFVFFHFQDSKLSVLKGLQFYFCKQRIRRPSLINAPCLIDAPPPPYDILLQNTSNK